MSVIIILIIISILVALFFLAVFFWAVRSGQFDDTVSPSIRMLFDEKRHKKTNGAEKDTEEEK
ncbi:MAG: cbb3-type cytochrome oxidase assembly protein CcoS [Cyclobacteriaceae bacterium]|nr:cbb3-type cytochrome oxidase assembly protein CcoS [Cyclobacteriaceae bacterium]